LPQIQEWTKSAEEEAEIDKSAAKVVLTTASLLEGFRVLETVEIITAEHVYSLNIIEDLYRGLSETFGGVSKTSQTILRQARKDCLSRLKREAAAIGANAVIAVDLAYSECRGIGKSMLFLVASGTAVKAERLSDGGTLMRPKGCAAQENNARSKEVRVFTASVNELLRKQRSAV
jgi:uncharacterized protein YbjQ (UPF0145 family)